jgi:N,N'-diacetylbacillosaminyl-diphospho-undecaprenol alpha-1,3-N-acetylgalactosaminyltransferase
MRKVALVSNADFSLYNFRMGLIRAFLVKGYQVHIVCPDGEHIEALVKQGVEHHPLIMDRKGTNPVNELKTVWQLYRIFRKEKFDAVHGFTIKPNIYGNIAAKMAGVPAVINTVPGLGYVFTGNARKRRLLRILVVALYRFAFKFASRVIFLNDDDFELFRNYGIGKSSRGIVIRSEGIDSDRYSVSNVRRDRLEKVRSDLGLSEDCGQLIVTMIGRLIWDKGVREFVEASRLVRSKHANVLFLLVGQIDEGNPAAVPEEYVTGAEREGLVRYLGRREDVPEILSISDIVTLPSYYREGTPRVLLEAMSMCKPVITTNSVGCKEVVEEGKNGYLVQPKDHIALASAIEELVIDEQLRIAMGEYGRQKVLSEFEERGVVGRIMQIYDELLP